MYTVHFTQVSTHLENFMQQVNVEHQPIRVEHPDSYRNAILLSEDDYQGLVETLYLLGNPANAEKLLPAVARGPAEAKSWEEVKHESGL